MRGYHIDIAYKIESEFGISCSNFTSPFIVLIISVYAVHEAMRTLMKLMRSARILFTARSFSVALVEFRVKFFHCFLQNETVNTFANFDRLLLICSNCLGFRSIEFVH